MWKSYNAHAVLKGVARVNGDYLYDAFTFKDKPAWKHVSEELWLRRNSSDDRWVISTTPKLIFGREEESIFHTDENGADASEPGSDGWKIAAKHANEVASGPTVTPSRLRAQFRVSNCSKNKEMNGDYVLDADFKVVGFPTWKHTTKDYFIRRDLADTCWLISTKVPENQTPRAGWHFFTCEDGVDKFEPSEHGAVDCNL